MSNRCRVDRSTLRPFGWSRIENEHPSFHSALSASRCGNCRNRGAVLRPKESYTSAPDRTDPDPVHACFRSLPVEPQNHYYRD